MTTEPTPPSPTDGAADPLTIFLVEDSTIIRDNLIALMHETLPLQVLGSASSEEDARRALTDGGATADLVIVDIFLRGGSGLGVLAARHQLAATGRWVVLSNHTTPEMRRKCIELGADAVFDKSNEIDSLLLYCKRLAGGDVLGDARNSLEAALD